MADKTQDPNPSYGIFGLNSPEPQRSAQGETPQAPQAQPGTPQYIYVQGPPPASAPGGAGRPTPFWLVVVLLIATAVNLYLAISTRKEISEAVSKQSDQLNLLTRRLDSTDERYAQLSGKFQVTTERLGLTQQELSRARGLAADIQKQQQEAVSQLNEAIAKKASADELNKAQADANAKIGGLSTDLAGTKKDLEATKDALMGTKGELTSAIARTHDELVALAHKTDRDYYEFNVRTKGKKGEAKIGTVAIELTKTDIRRNKFTVNLYFDDKVTERKDKAIMEPVYFYMQGASSALELVVNKLGKDSIVGYVSAPKGFLSGVPNILAGRPGM